MSGALQEVARMIQWESGIRLEPSQLPALEAAIARVDCGLTAETLLERAVSAQTLGRLIDEVTIRETFFFRHRCELDAIAWHSMLDAARARGSDVVQIWVAGCASGEEAYTVAILACEAFASARPPVRVLATDIAPAALAQATAGRYGERAVRDLQGGVRERYFSSANGVSSVSERLRALVEFRRHNLVRDPIPPAGERSFDVILCRNVLIYFDRPTVEVVLEALEGALAPAGQLLLGAADRLCGQARPLQVAPAPLYRPTPALPSRPTPTPPSRPTPADAMRAADRGELDLAVGIARDVLALDPLDPQAHFIQGVAELARDDARAAVEPLRRALYIDPNFGLAAFKLACAHDALGEEGPARRAYERTLRTLDHRGSGRTARSGTAHTDRPALLSMAAACHARLQALSAASPATPRDSRGELPPRPPRGGSSERATSPRSRRRAARS